MADGSSSLQDVSALVHTTDEPQGLADGTSAVTSTKKPNMTRKASMPFVPSEPPKRSNNGHAKPLMSDHAGIDVHEEYSKDEVLLNEFTKLHPMTSMEATTSKTMQLIAGMLETSKVRVPEMYALTLITHVHNCSQT